MLKAIFFDFDGVIWDTYEFGMDLCKRFDPLMTEQDFIDHHKWNVYESPKIRFQSGDMERYFALQKELITRSYLFPLEGILQDLSQRFPLFIVSSTPDENLNLYLSTGSYEKYFKEALGATTHKSKKRKFEMMFEKYNLKSEECVFVTDTTGDIKEAREVNLRAIAVTWGYHSKELLESEGPFSLVDTPEELLEVIDGIE